MFKNPKNQKTMALVLFCNTIIYYTLHTHSQRNLSRIPFQETSKSLKIKKKKKIIVINGLSITYIWYSCRYLLSINMLSIPNWISLRVAFVIDFQNYGLMVIWHLISYV